jgi:hypothetical protein
MSTNKLWYQEAEEAQQAQAMTNAARALYRDQGESRRRAAEDALTLWSGSMNHTLTGASPLGVLGLNSGETAGYNGVQAIVDSKANATLRNEVRPLFVTEGGDSELREKVEAMQDACDGQRYALGLEDEMEEQACWNGYIFGNGGVEFWPDTANSRIVVTPVWDFNYFVSRQEARQGAPQQLFGRYVIPRDVLASFVANEPKIVRDAVDSAPSASFEDSRMFDTMDSQVGTIADLVVIYKAWHLPSTRVDMDDPRAFGKSKDGNRAKANHDGLHMVSLDGGQKGPTVPIISRPWPYQIFPVSWFKPNRVPGSWWGRGEPEILATSQTEMNQWDQREYKILDRFAQPSLILPKGTRLNPAQLSNADFKILQVEGMSGPQVWNPQSVPGDLLGRRERLAQQMRDQRGMSEMSMTAKKPGGINHEPGLAYLANTESIRHTAEFRAWKRFKLDCDKLIVWCFKELSESDPNFEVVYEKDEQLVRARMTDIDPGSEKYRIKARGTNLFSQDPAQQAEHIANFVDRGLLPPKALFDAVKSPDLQALADSKEVMRKNACKRVKDVAKGPAYDESMMPQAYNDLATMKEECLKMLNFVEMNEEGQDKIDRLTDFLADVDKLLGIVPADPNAIAAGNPALAQAPGMAQAMGGGGGPPPMAGPPPAAPGGMLQ